MYEFVGIALRTKQTLLNIMQKLIFHDLETFLELCENDALVELW